MVSKWFKTYFWKYYPVVIKGQGLKHILYKWSSFYTETNIFVLQLPSCSWIFHTPDSQMFSCCTFTGSRAIITIQYTSTKDLINRDWFFYLRTCWHCSSYQGCRLCWWIVFGEITGLNLHCRCSNVERSSTNNIILRKTTKMELNTVYNGLYTIPTNGSDQTHFKWDLITVMSNRTWIPSSQTWHEYCHPKKDLNTVIPNMTWIVSSQTWYEYCHPKKDLNSVIPNMTWILSSQKGPE